VAFIDRINRGDLDGLIAMMAPGHVMRVRDEPPVSGSEALATAWSGYFAAFPRYVVYPRAFVEHGDHVAMLGSTTGSHLGLPDEEERRIDVVWTAEVKDGKLLSWTIVEDTPETRRRLGLPWSTP
jgi:ketosteroid isomerase-like protein